MNQQQHSIIPVVPTQPPQLVQVEGRTYQITEVSQSPYPIASQPIKTRSTALDDPVTVIAIGLGCVFLGGAIAWLVVKAFAPAPLPVTPTAQPQTVIIQPPQPEKRPYTRRDCRPDGFMGLGQSCTEERGYQ